MNAFETLPVVIEHTYKVAASFSSCDGIIQPSFVVSCTRDDIIIWRHLSNGHIIIYGSHLLQDQWNVKRCLVHADDICEFCLIELQLQDVPIL